MGRHPRVLEILSLVDRVAPTDAPILITGESGTGKDLLAREIHAKSARRDRPYISVNCGAIADALEESELFGYAPGAFTGAVQRKQGKFEAAHEGTIFLDEIGEMSPQFQVKLLRILQDGEYAPVGVAKNCYCNVRVIAATNQDLKSMVEAGRFRPDLYYRINVIRLFLPPLRERGDDVRLLADHFKRRFARLYHLSEPEMDPEFEAFLLAYDFPGNVRELSNIIQRSMIMSGDDGMSTRWLPRGLKPRRLSISAAHLEEFHAAKRRLVEEFEREYLLAVIRECGGVVRHAAERSGLSERCLHDKLKAYGIDNRGFRRRSSQD